MDDDSKLVNLTTRRNARKRSEQKRRLETFMPSYTARVWLVFLAVTVVSYLAFGRS